MKYIMLLIVLCLSVFPVVFAVDDARISALEQQVQELQYLNYTKYFNISGSLANHYESYRAKANPGTDSEGKSSVSTLSTIFALNINFDVSERLKVYTRLGMSKFWNHDAGGRANQDRHEPEDAWDASNTGSYGYWGSIPRFDRAYMSYNFKNSNFTFAIGRLPTNGGPPTEKIDGIDRQGTYPRFAYNAIFDGMGLDYDASHWLSKNDSLSFRVFYSPFVNIDKYDRRTRRTDEFVIGSSHTAKSLTPQYTFQADFEKRNLSWLKGLQLTYFFYNYTDFYQYGVGDDVANTADDYLLTPYEATAHMGYIGFDKILGTGLGINVSYLDVKSKMKYIDTPEDNADTSSSAFLVNTNYSFANSLMKNHVLSAEYVKTDKNFYIDDFNYYYLNDFYKADNSSGYHISYSLPLDDNIRFRPGVFVYEKKEGSTEAIARDVTSYYATLFVSF